MPTEPALTIAVLGPVEVQRDDQLLAIPSGKPTEVLVRLALEAGTLVRAERLIEDLWAGTAAATAKNTLQSKVSQLRRALGDPTLIVGGNGGYTLAVEPETVDATAATALAAGAAAALRSGDAARSLDLATEALALFRGDALVDAGDAEWADVHRARLVELRLALVEDQFAARVTLGAGGDVIGALESLVAEHPLREGLWASLITALYRAGRQAEALAAYTRLRDTLIDELGIEPGPRLRALEDQILQQSPDLDATGAAGATTVAATPGNLPGLTSPLVGRIDDLAALTNATEQHRLVTLVGPAGVGKTRLAIEVARHLDAPSGVWLIRLDGVDASTPIAQVVAEALHVAGGEPMLFERVSGSPTTLVLDNCEHVVDAVADLVHRLLDHAPSLRILATSQLPIGLDGESTYALEPLPIDASMELFAARAAEMRRQFVLDDDTALVVEEVCRSLDGLPLAIELAAARVKSLSVHEIARRLDDRFALLQDPTSRRPERRRALSAAISWSYELLFPDDQRGLWALSAFAGGAPLAAAEHVLGALGVPTGSVVDVVGRLVDRSLVSVEESADGVIRYRLLDSIGAYAAERLADAGLADDAAAAHAAWFAAEADHCAATVKGSGQAACLVFVRAERSNIDLALAWTAEHDPGLGVRIANGLGWTWVVLGDGVAGAARVRNALTAGAAAATPAQRAEGLLLAGWLEASAGDVGQAETDLDGAMAIAHQLDDPVLRADVQRHLAFLRIQQGRPQDVLDEAAASLAVYGDRDLAWESTGSLLLSSFGSIMLGDTVQATKSAADAVALLAPIGDSWGLIHAEAMIGAIAQAERRLDAAATALASASIEAERLGFLGQAALHLTTLGRVQQLAGEEHAAIETLERAIAAGISGGDLRIASTARLHLARLRLAAGEPATARLLAEQADRWYRDSGGGDGALLARFLLARTAAEEDRAALIDAVLESAREVANGEVEVVALDALALAAADEGRLDDATQLLSAADEAVVAVQHLVDDADRVDARNARSLVAAD